MKQTLSALTAVLLLAGCLSSMPPAQNDDHVQMTQYLQHAWGAKRTDIRARYMAAKGLLDYKMKYPDVTRILGDGRPYRSRMMLSEGGVREEEGVYYAYPDGTIAIVFARTWDDIANWELQCVSYSMNATNTSGGAATVDIE